MVKQESPDSPARQAGLDWDKVLVCTALNQVLRQVESAGAVLLRIIPQQELVGGQAL